MYGNTAFSCFDLLVCMPLGFFSMQADRRSTLHHAVDMELCGTVRELLHNFADVHAKDRVRPPSALVHRPAFTSPRPSFRKECYSALPLFLLCLSQHMAPDKDFQLPHAVSAASQASCSTAAGTLHKCTRRGIHTDLKWCILLLHAG